MNQQPCTRRWLFTASSLLDRQGPRGAYGLLNFKLALQYEGVLQGPSIADIGKEEEPQDSASPFDAIVDVLWPVSSTTEETLRARTAQLSGRDVASVAWEFYALRLEIFHFACSIQFDDDAAHRAVFDQIEPGFEARLRGVPVPADFSAWKGPTDLPVVSRCTQ